MMTPVSTAAITTVIPDLRDVPLDQIEIPAESMADALIEALTAEVSAT